MRQEIDRSRGVELWGDWISRGQAAREGCKCAHKWK
jgi:hypothetical protein